MFKEHSKFSNNNKILMGKIHEDTSPNIGGKWTHENMFNIIVH